VFIHASYLRPDQIQRIKAVGAVPSFLVASISSGGDAVERFWGPERAARAAGAQTFQTAGLPYTLSHDAPVSPQPTILGLVDAAVNRRTASGRVIGPAERISPYDALRAVTVMAAYQIKEEKGKGSLEPGKLADLIILDHNSTALVPLYDVYSTLVYATSPRDVRTTIIHGRVIMEDRKLLTLDPAEVRERMRAISRRINTAIATGLK
jgi:predicted amidohydrolase YtcJ